MARWRLVGHLGRDCWDSKRHVVRPFEVPAEWMRFRSMDWGSASPFSVGWWAVVQDDFDTDGRVLPRGCLVRYREWYGMKPGQPNVRVKINADVIGLSIAAREKDEKISYGVLDPSAFAEDGGPSLAERISKGSGEQGLLPARGQQARCRAWGHWGMGSVTSAPGRRCRRAGDDR